MTHIVNARISQGFPRSTEMTVTPRPRDAIRCSAEVRVVVGLAVGIRHCGLGLGEWVGPAASGLN